MWTIRLTLALVAILAAGGILLAQRGGAKAGPQSLTPYGLKHRGEGPETQQATFAAGCFWGVEEAFRQVDGVVATTVGYTGGHFANPTYDDVCSHRTGHAEAVLVEYDPARVSYDQLLDVFWKIHNPTAERESAHGPGYQYRSAIWYHTEQQHEAALAKRAALERAGRSIGTEILPDVTFWRAEDYHQQYEEKHGNYACPLP